jgi:hypothetical protein
MCPEGRLSLEVYGAAIVPTSIGTTRVGSMRPGPSCPHDCYDIATIAPVLVRACLGDRTGGEQQKGRRSTISPASRGTRSNSKDHYACESGPRSVYSIAILLVRRNESPLRPGRGGVDQKGARESKKLLDARESSSPAPKQWRMVLYPQFTISNQVPRPSWSIPAPLGAQKEAGEVWAFSDLKKRGR